MMNRILVILFSMLACAASIGMAVTVKAAPMRESASVRGTVDATVARLNSPLVTALNSDGRRVAAGFRP
jgi:hypothetical protein